MRKRRSSSAVSEKRPVAPSPNIAGQPNTQTALVPPSEVQAKPWRPRLWMLVVCIAVIVGALILLQFIGYLSVVGGDDNHHDNSSDTQDWSRAPVAGDERVCTQFIQLKNAGDPAAVNLLGPAPAIPDGPVSRIAADRLQADIFLRQDVRIVGVGRDRATRGLVLFTSGNVSAPTLHVRTATGVETAQRTMSNPDLTVEVRDGRIYGVAASLHLGS